MRHARPILVVFAFAVVLACPHRAQANNEVCLEAVGGTAAGYVYSTYMLIGVTADALMKKAYDAGRVKQLMKVAIKMMAESSRQLGKVKKAGLSKEDRFALEEFQAILGLLQDQARALNAYASSGDAKDAKRYEKLRQRVWTRIAKLLGIEQQP